MNDLIFGKFCKENNMFMDCDSWIYQRNENDEWKNSCSQPSLLFQGGVYKEYPNPSSDKIDEVLPRIINTVYGKAVLNIIYDKNSYKFNLRYMLWSSSEIVFIKISNTQKKVKQQMIKELKKFEYI